MEKDYHGLGELIKETRAAFGDDEYARTITAAYYPDGRQEQLLLKYGVDEFADFLHIMAYDQTNGHHSSLSFAEKVINQGKDILPASQLTLGLPFYGRNSATGDWKTYEDIVQQSPSTKNSDSLPGDNGGAWLFNGPSTIATKTELAIQAGAGGVMVWEVGQDCRRVAVKRDGVEHRVTCPNGPEDSLLKSIAKVCVRCGPACVWHVSTQVYSVCLGFKKVCIITAILFISILSFSRHIMT